ncbi:MAG: metalloregulator ArsR/SmtB family transcription factor [Candidatus Methanoperedens sp.]|nr:metalloregulator ArsR/SmtB family transcription factor [Candidatus Methanoperedens sp.]
MSNDLFKALSSTTRLKMLRILAKNEMHIAGLARELDLSNPVVARHVNILETAGLIERKKFGKTHVLRSRIENIDKLMNSLADTCEVNVPKGASILEALKKVSGVEVKEVRDKEFVISIDGEQGFYMYEVNGKPPDTTVQDFKIEKDSTIEWKKLVPVTRKRIIVKIDT